MASTSAQNRSQTRPIAIDGPAASGKSTVARLVAVRLGGTYINTGDMYRTLTWCALQRGIDPERDPGCVVAMLADLNLRYEIDAAGAPELHLDGKPVHQNAIRAPEIARHVSAIAKIPAVRAWLRPRQRETQRFGTVVMEGRDIGTVIFPETPLKFFLTASPEVRARRRLAQAGEVPENANIEQVAAEIARRDHIDSSRAVAPLKAAPDALVIETDSLTAAEVAERIAAHVRGGGQRQ